MIDIVYALGSGSKWDNNELRYSLRSLEKNFLDLRNIYIVGTFPHFLQDPNPEHATSPLIKGVGGMSSASPSASPSTSTSTSTSLFHLPLTDPFPSNKDANIIRKVLKACAQKELSNNFLFMNDDYYINKPISETDMKAWYLSYMSQYKDDWFNENNWKAAVKRTYDFLKARNFSCYHFDGSHCPQIYNKWTFQQVMNRVGWDGELGYTISNLYLNITGAEPHFVGNCKKAFVENDLCDLGMKEAIRKATFISNNDSGLSDDFKNLLQELFPTPSKFEFPRASARG